MSFSYNKLFFGLCILSAAAFLFLSLGSASAAGVGIIKKPNQVQNISIVDKVDRDGDGKISDFDVRLRVTSETFKFPSKKFRKIKKGVSEAISSFTPIPASWMSGLTYKATLAPEFCVAAVVKNNKPIPLKDWWLPTRKNSTAVRDFNVSSNKFIHVGSGKDSLGIQIESGKLDQVKAIEVKTHYKAIEEKGLKAPTGKVTVKNSKGKVKRALNHPCGVSALKEVHRLGSNDGLKVEPSNQDRMGRVRFTSDPDGVEIFVDGNSIGVTPLVNDFPVDMNEKVEIKAKKDDYETKVKQVELNPTKAAKQVIKFKLNRIKKPIVVKSTPSGASITINDGVTPYKTPHTLDTWIKRSPTITVSNDDNSQTFKDVKPPATLEANLKSGSKKTGSGNNNFFTPNIPGDLGQSVQIPDLDYSDIIPPNLNLTAVAARFSAAPTTTQTGNKVEFDAGSSYSMAANIDSYNWDFGDGSAAKGEQVSHVYTDDGNYTVQLTIADKNGKTDSNTKTIKVNNRKPVAQFSSSKFEAFVGEKVSFDASTSSDADGKINSFSWSFGDGNTTQGSKVSHTYSSSSNYKVELTVEDDDQAIDKMVRRINIKAKNKPPQAKIKAPQKVGVDQEFKLDGSGSVDSDGAIVRYDWLINNNEYLSGATTTYKFNSTGTQKINLSVMDSDSQRDEVSATIEVVAEKVEIQKKEQKQEEDSWWEEIIQWFKNLFGLDN